MNRRREKTVDWLVGVSELLAVFPVLDSFLKPGRMDWVFVASSSMASATAFLIAWMMLGKEEK